MWASGDHLSVLDLLYRTVPSIRSTTRHHTATTTTPAAPVVPLVRGAKVDRLVQLVQAQTRGKTMKTGRYAFDY